MKKRIAFLSSMPLEDKRNWSGTMFNLYQSLEKQGFNITWIPLPQYSDGENKLFTFIKEVYQKTFNRTFNQHHFFLKSWFASKRLQRKLKKENFDVLFVPTYATEIGFLNIKQPIVYLNDATFHQLINYYPAFSGLGYLSKKITAALEKKGLQKANAIIFSSEWATQHARDFYNSLFSLHQLRDHWNKYIGVGISFPILSGLDRNAGIRKKKLNLQRVRNSIEEEKLHLRNETERIVLSLHLGWEEHRQASLQVKAETQVLKETERKWEEGLVSVFQLMEARNRLLVAKAEKIRVRLQYELTSRLTMYYRTGSFINH
jgi:ADP-heptose:LPS heptosyltransferase